MKRSNHIPSRFILAAIAMVVISSCGVKREPGSAYMPDMAYSRAYETNILRDPEFFSGNRDSAEKYHKIFYSNKPVSGTMRIYEEDSIMPYELPNDSNGYKMSAQVINPVTSFSPADSAEAGRLFNINCAVCHGAKGAGNGPISQKIGAVANLTTQQYISMTDGTMFHSITYGRNNMGSYASQLSRVQRWLIIKYIRTLQPKPSPADAATTAKPAADTTAKAKGIK